MPDVFFFLISTLNKNKTKTKIKNIEENVFHHILKENKIYLLGDFNLNLLQSRKCFLNIMKCHTYQKMFTPLFTK